MYDFNQHKHNYAVWTAARAVQRGFTTTAVIKSAIEQTGLRQYAETTVGHESFESFHRKVANKLIQFIEKSAGINCSYGRAAKIISIYLKTSVILCNNGNCDRSRVIHPPIDSILLNGLSGLSGFKDLREIRWTQLDESKYWDLVAKLKQCPVPFDWTLEEYWSPERD